MNQSQIPESRLYRGFVCRDAYKLTYINSCPQASIHLNYSIKEEPDTVLNSPGSLISTYVKIQRNKKVRISIFVAGECLHSITYGASHNLNTLEKAVDKAIDLLTSIFGSLLINISDL